MKRQAYGTLALLIGIGTSFAFSACGKKKDDKVLGESSELVPASVDFKKPTPGTPLTDLQIAFIKDTFKNRPSMILPPGKLIFPSKKAKPEDIAASEAKLKEQDSNSYAFLKDIQSGCQKTEPTRKFESTIPFDENKKLQGIRVGDTASTSLDAVLIGNQCPVDSSLTAKGDAEYKQVDSDALSGAATVIASGKFKGLINDQKYAKLLASRGLLMETKVTGISAQRDTKGRTAYEANTTGTYMTLEQEVGFTSNIKYAGHIITMNTSLGVADSVYETTLRFKDFSATLIVHTYPVNNGVQTDAFLNGNPVTQKELNDIFGDNSPSALQEKSGLGAALAK